MRTKAKLTASSVVNDILCGRLTGMSARITRTPAIFIALTRRRGVFGGRRRGGGAGGGGLKPVPSNADGPQKSPAARPPADDGVAVGRERPEACPAAGDA